LSNTKFHGNMLSQRRDFSCEQVSSNNWHLFKTWNSKLKTKCIYNSRQELCWFSNMLP